MEQIGVAQQPPFVMAYKTKTNLFVNICTVTTDIS